MMNWTTVFQPVINASTKNLEPRPQQEELGNAIIDSISGKHNLIAQATVGTGKSFAVLVPIINAVLESKKSDKHCRAVVSTETLSLQDQYAKTDLPALSKVYPGFTFKVLKGRSNYLCFHQIKSMARGNTKVASILRRIDQHRGSLGAGERNDLERFLKENLENWEWALLAGTSIGCQDHGADPENCYSDRARAAAANSDIVVVNHAILRVDAESRVDEFNDDNFLGQVDILAVDEAHTLEGVLISGWTEELTEWEILEKTSKIVDAVDFGKGLINNANIGYRTQQANDGILNYLKAVTDFFKLRHPEQEWKKVEDTISLKYIAGSSAQIMKSMEKYEVKGLASLNFAIEVYEECLQFFKDVVEKIDESGVKGKRKISKGRSACIEVLKTVKKVAAAMETKDGTFQEFGIPYIVTASGIERRNGDHSVRLKTIPLDISAKATDIWMARTCILMSGTIVDLTDNSFDYIASSLGFENFKTISTDSPFSHDTQQLVYVTPGLKQRADLRGAQFSVEELVDLIEAANGRTLALFTAYSELQLAVDTARQLKADGKFPWTILAQEPGVNKSRVFEEFKNDVNSVLFASKSAFTGNDFPGETVSLVVLAKFPLPQYSAMCKQQIVWWRKRGFPNWYEREALAVFHQAAGRLIRNKTDSGVIALLDQRATDITEKVCQTALTGVNSLGSPVTQDISVVRKMLAK